MTPSTALTTALILLLAGAAAGQECGDVLAAHRGVPAFSNGRDQGFVNSCDGTGPFGGRYQDVEYVRRFHAATFMTDTTTPAWAGDALSYFNEARLAQRGLQKFVNGASLTPPAVDDILVLGGMPASAAGHLAIVTLVTPSEVTVIEQDSSPTGMATLPLTRGRDGTFQVGDHGRDGVRGWVRRVSAKIRVDGNKADWKRVPVFMADPTGDGDKTADGTEPPGGDLVSLRITNTDCEVFFLLEFAGLPEVSANLLLDTDENAATGCPAFLGAEVLARVGQITGEVVPQAQLVDWSGCWFAELLDFSEYMQFAIGRDTIEMSIPVAVLKMLSPGTQGFFVHASTGVEGDQRADFLQPPLQYEPNPPFSESCVEVESPDPGGSIGVGSMVFPPPASR
jgi:hypothetical protein